MAAPTTVDEALEQAALSPAVVSSGSRSVHTQDIRALLEYKRAMDAEAAAASSTSTASGGFGLRFAQIQPPAAG